jgi:phosphatidylserine/phosphatidylglycerophosphate/cardiolipin synthase-like enzyme
MTDTSRWQAIFPDAVRTDVTAHIDGDAYFGALTRAIEATTGPEHFVIILGWMLDIELPMTGSSATTPLSDLLEQAAKRGVRVIIAVWRNPIYLKALAKADKWAKRQKASKSLTFIVDDYTVGSPRTKDLLEYIAQQINGLHNISKYQDGIIAARIGLEINKGDPSALDIEKWIRAVDFSICAHHEKNVAVFNKDGLFGFCGGIDLNKNRVRPAKKEKHFFDGDEHFFHDVATQVNGEAAKGIFDKCLIRLSQTYWGVMNRQTLKDMENGVKSVQESTDTSAEYVQIVGTYNYKSTSNKPIRTAGEALAKIASNAKKYIYIEDQYLVNIDIAKIINTKIKEKDFQFAMLVVQDSDETGDILVPNRKRQDFIQTALSGASSSEREKLVYAVVNKDPKSVEKYGYHTGLHSKVLIVDDEIAMVGSCNVNRRSFKLDSETSAVVFGGKFAQSLRFALWNHTLQDPLTLPDEQDVLVDPTLFPSYVQMPWQGPVEMPIRKTPHFQKFKSTFLLSYKTPNKVDFDVRVADIVKKHPNYVKWIGGKTLEDIVSKVWTLGGMPQASVQDILDSPDLYVPRLVDVVWDNIIDPN